MISPILALSSTSSQLIFSSFRSLLMFLLTQCSWSSMASLPKHFLDLCWPQDPASFPLHCVLDLTSFPTIAYWQWSSSLGHFQTRNPTCSLSSCTLSTLWDKVNGFNLPSTFISRRKHIVGILLLQCFTCWRVFTSFSPWPLLWPFHCCHTSMGSPRKRNSSALLTFTASCCSASAVLLPWKANKTYPGLLPKLDTAWHLCLRARSRCCKVSAHPYIQGSCHQLAPSQHYCVRHPLAHPKKTRQLPHLCQISVIALNQAAGFGMGIYTTFSSGIELQFCSSGIELQFCFSISSDISQVL